MGHVLVDGQCQASDGTPPGNGGGAVGSRPRAGRKPAAAGKLILIVDDNALTLKLFTDLLQSRGYRTAAAVDGPSALAATRRHRPALVLMDLQLPGMSGLEAAAAIKADADLRHIPVIAVTAFAMKGDEAAARKAGCEGYVAKPVSVHKLLEVVSTFVGAAGDA